MAKPKLKSKALATLFLLLLMMCVSVVSNNNNKDGLPDYEAEYLLKLRGALHNPPSNWFDNKTGMCSWTGVQCTTLPGMTNSQSQHVNGIDLAYKKLTGTIPPGLNDSLMYLSLLNLPGSSLTGPLPSLAGLSSLQSVILFDNDFTSIPQGCFQGLDYLQSLALSGNTNLAPWTFPADLQRSPRLSDLELSATNLIGSLPDIFESFPVLEVLYLSENNLSGVLPKSFAKLTMLSDLDLSHQKGSNKLSGTIHFLSSFPELLYAYLDGNSFEGSIPNLSDHTEPLSLLLANNRLTGVVPPSLFLSNKINIATLENNWLQGPLPIFNHSTTNVTFGGNGFCLNHSGPCDYRVTTLLQVAEAFGYPFLLAKSWRGNNPCQGWDFITCYNNGNIRTVNLTNLNLMGTISPAFQNLTDLYELYLGGNKLSGSIPESFTTLQHLKIVDVSNNNLSGNIPPFSNKVKLITAGNALLRQPYSQAKLSHPWIVGISMVGSGVGVILIAIVAYNYKTRVHLLQRTIQKKESSSSEQELEELLKYYGTSTPIRYTYEEVKQMTNLFCEKLGQGGYGTVYKASLVDGRQVAVKVLKETKASVEEFVNEIVTISKTSHVNIVSLLGFCYEMNIRTLIYEYMSNGSLDKFIYKNGSSHLISNIDCSSLLQIAISVARGLEYLHRGCNTRILHLDIKPQNILLDENFCPKIADFGLAKICKKDESIVSILGTRGTPGFIAPEMFSRMYGGVSSKSDVYSYGMLILEIIGGKRNYDTGDSQSNELYFFDWIYKDLEEGNIHTDEENDIIMKITLVGLWCIQINPTKRPSMSKVVEMLEGPLQTIPYPPKPVVSSPTRPPLPFSDASHSVVYETNSIEEVND